MIRNSRYKYDEYKILTDFQKYLNTTYNAHYSQNENDIDFFDVLISLGNSDTSFRDIALKYLWRYGQKGGKNKEDLLKLLHYTIMLLYTDHYMPKKPFKKQ